VALQGRGQVLLPEPIEDIDQFVELLPVLAVTLGDGVLDAVIDMMAEHRKADSVQGSLGSCQLLQNLNAGSRFLDHAPDSAHLPLDAVQATDKRLRIIGLGLQTVINRLISGRR
jgi:hypothetical protein